MIQNAKAERRAGERAGLPICPFCCSTDTMEPFTRTARVAILSRVLPRLRRRYCRSCTRHFLMFMERVRPA